VLTRIVDDLVEATTQFDGAFGLGNRLKSLLYELESTQQIAIYRGFASSASPALRALGLGGLISHGDTNALLEAERDAATFAGKPTQSSLASVSSVVSTDPRVIDALVRLATNRNPKFYLRNSARNALENIHSRETLPYFALLLDSPDPFERQRAVSSFSAFAVGLPVFARDSNVSELIDKLFNVNWRHKTGAEGRDPLAGLTSAQLIERNHFSFGTFQDSTAEARLVGFWKDWAQAKGIRPLLVIP